MFEKTTVTLYKNDPFTDREISLLKEAVEKLATDASSQYLEIEKAQILKKIAALSFACEK